MQTVGHKEWDDISRAKVTLAGSVTVIELPRITTARKWHVVHNIGSQAFARWMKGYGNVNIYTVIPRANDGESFNLKIDVRLSQGHPRIFDEVVDSACQKMCWGRFGQARNPFAIFGRRAVPLAGIKAFPYQLDAGNQITWADFKAFADGMRKNVLPSESQMTLAKKNDAGQYESTGEALSSGHACDAIEDQGIEMKIAFRGATHKAMKMAERFVPALVQSLVGAKGEVVAVAAGYDPTDIGFPKEYGNLFVTVAPSKGHRCGDIIPAVVFANRCIAKGDFGQPRI